MADPADDILDMLRASADGLTYADLRQAMPAASEQQITGALHRLSVRGAIVVGTDRRWRMMARRKSGRLSTPAPSERTRRGGVETAEGFVPYYPHPSGWMLPVKTDDRGRPIRRNRRLVYALPGGGEFQPEDEQSIARKLEGRE